VERGKAINKKVFWLVAFLFLAAGTFAEAQQQAKVPKIGWLGPVPVQAAGSSHSGESSMLRARISTGYYTFTDIRDGKSVTNRLVIPSLSLP
jgi:hypothetical protein